MKEFNFSKKRKAQMFTIITTLLLCVTACAFSNFDTYAEEVFSYQDSYDFSNIQFLHYADNDTDFQYARANTIAECQYLINSGLFTCPSSYSINTTTFPNYVIIYNNSNHRFYVMYCDADAFVTVYRGESGLINLNSSNFDGNFKYRISRWTYPTGYSETLDDFTQSNPSRYHVYENSESEEYTTFFNCSLYGYEIVASSVPIYVEQAPVNHVSDLYLDDVENVNPTVTGSIGNVSSEQWDNYEYLTGNSGIYAALTSCNGGKMQFVAEAPTGMNTDNYYIKINGECSYSVTVNSLTDTRTKNVLSRYTSYESSASSFTKTISASGTIGSSYDLVFEHNGIQLSALNNGVYNAPQVNINNELKSGSNAPIYYLADYCTDNSVALWRGVMGSMSGLSATASAGEYGTYGYSLPTMEVVNRSPMTVNSIVYSYTMTMYNEKDESVGSLTKTFTINSNGTVSESEGANTLTVPNDVVEQNTTGGADYYNHSTNSNDTYNSTDNSTGTGGGSSVNGDNNIIINNNPVNNVNGGSASGLTETDDSSFGSGFGVISKIISYIAGSKGSSVDKIDELANTDGWLSIVTSSYSFVPIQFWNLIITCFTVCLGIVIVAFIISIVIKLVT